MSEDDIDPETERRMAANLLQGRRSRETVVETRRSRLRRPGVKQAPHFEVVRRDEQFDQVWAFDLVSGDQRVEVGREYDFQDANQLRRKIDAMGLRVEWVSER